MAAPPFRMLSYRLVGRDVVKQRVGRVACVVVIVARELTQGAKLVIAAQPTRGVDVGSIEFIHRQLADQRDAGVAVLLVSAELDEILSLSDRIVVLYEGRIQAVIAVGDATREGLGLLMAGAGAQHD